MKGRKIMNENISNTEEYPFNKMVDAITLSLKTSVSGEIDCPCDEMWYKFIANGYRAHLQGEDGKYTIKYTAEKDMIVYLYDASCNLIEAWDSGKSISSDVVLEQNETYYICLKISDNTCGSYQLYVDFKTNNDYSGASSSVASYVPLKRWIYGNIRCDCEEKWYKFVADGDAHNYDNLEEYIITVRGSVYANVYLYEESMNLIGVSEDFYDYEKKIYADLEYGKTYYLCVKGDYDIGEYNLKIDYINQAAAIANGMASNDFAYIDHTNTGELLPHTNTWFRFRSNASRAHLNGVPGVYYIFTRGDKDTRGYLYNSRGEKVAYCDCGGSYNNFYMTVTLDYDETYYLCIKGKGEECGDFELQISYKPVPLPGTCKETAIELPLNQNYYDELCCPGDVKWYKFTANASDNHNEDGEGGYAFGGFGVWGMLGVIKDSEERPIKSFLETVRGMEFSYTVKLNYGETYYLCVNASDDNVGEYYIQATTDSRIFNTGSSMNDAIVLPFNKWTEGSIDTAKQSKWYMFIVEDHCDNVTIHTDADADSGVRLEGELYDCEGNFITSDNVVAEQDEFITQTNFEIVKPLAVAYSYYICVTGKTNATGSFRIRATDESVAQTLDILPRTKTIKVGEVYQLTSYITPATAARQDLNWGSRGEAIATVDSMGRVTGKAPGYVQVYATTTDGTELYNYCYITVESSDVKLSLTPNSVSVYAGNTVSLKTELTGEIGTENTFEWISSNKGVATVDGNGVVTAKSGGNTIISARHLQSNIVAYCQVYVNQVNTSSTEKQAESTTPGSTVADPVDAFTGAHLLSNTVMSLYGGQSLKLTINYNSTKLSSGVFGIGWYHNYEKHLEMTVSNIKVYSSPSNYSVYSKVSDGVYSCTAPDKNNHVLTVDYYDELPFVIDCNSEYKEFYNASGNLAKIVTHHGFETTITYTENTIALTDNVSGKSITLEKNGDGQVVRVYDDGGREASFTYLNNALSSMCNVNGNTMTFTYNENGQVLSGTDSEGICYFTNTYDEYGRVATQKDGISNSKLTLFVYKDNGERIITDRNGYESIRVFNDDGMLVRHTDGNGNTKTYSYDERYNLITETDANGNSSYKTYNEFNKPTLIIDKNGNETHMYYDDYANVTKIEYPEIDGLVPEESFVYNERNQMIEHIDVRGTKTVYTYDEASMPKTKKVGNRNALQYSYENGFLISQTDAKGNTTRYDYNEIGQLTTVTDSENNVTSHMYDNLGNLLSSVDANGGIVSISYDGNNQKKSEIDANGNITSYTYNGNMKNNTVTLPDCGKIFYEFDGEDRVVRTQDQAGNVTVTQYDKGGRIISKQLPDGAAVYYEYDKVGNIIKETNPKGAVVVKSYDAVGNLLSAMDDEGNIVQYQYNALGKVTRVVNAASGTTVYEYSKAGDLLSETDALENKKSYTYDEFGNKLTATDAKGNVTTYTYDTNNNLTSVRDALGNTTTYAYNSLNQLVSVTNARDNTVRYGYDALGRRTTITDAKNNVFTSVYDANGNVLKTVDAKGNTVSETVYNCLNLPAVVIDSTGKTVSYTYNQLGKVETATDSMNHRTEFTYNSRGQNTSVRDAANNMSASTYDLLGNVTCLAGPLGGATNYTYDDMGRLITESTVSGGTKSYEYNELNIRNKITNARGQVRQISHDVMGRVTGYTSPEGSVSYTYDVNGNVLTVTDSNGTITRTYDALNRVTSYTDTYGKVIRYEYDAVGNLTKLIYPDNTAVTYAYDANNNLITVTDWANRVTSYIYDANNRVVGVTKPDGSATTTVYDNHQRVVSTMERTVDGAIITGFEYTYDSLSRIVEEIHLAENTKICYTYDSLSRVIKRTVKDECDEVLSEENYSYDAAGNITAAPNSCFGYDINNRLTIFNGFDVAYDMDGNMLSNGEDAFAYDSANRLITANNHIYTYNAENVRIRNLCECCEETIYTYDTNCRLSKLLCKTTNEVVTKYVYGRDLIGEEVGSTFKTYHFDCRGSTIAITNTNGNITDTFKYDTYGKLIGRTGTSEVIFGYNGRDGVVTDDNGLIYMRARYYSPEMRRFINADIVAGKLSNAITLNRFAYANGNPVSFVDPFGLSSERIGAVLYRAWNGFYNTYDFFNNLHEDVSMYKFMRDASKFGFLTKKAGQYIIIKGARSPVALKQGIKGTRYAIKNADNYWDVFKNTNVKAGLKWELSIKLPNKKFNRGAILNYVGVAIDTLDGIVKNYSAGTDAQRIITDAAVDVGANIGIIAGSTAIGSAVGSAIPVAGNIIGACVGYAAGLGIDYLVNTEFEILGDKSVVDWVQEGVDVAADWVVEDLPDIAADAWEATADFVDEAWDATTDFVEDAGDWIADTASDAWEATTDFFSGIFG